MTNNFVKVLGYGLVILLATIMNFAVKAQNLEFSKRHLQLIDTIEIHYWHSIYEKVVYCKYYSNIDTSIIEVEVYNYYSADKVAKGYFKISPKTKYIQHGLWEFYDFDGKLRKKGRFERGYKVGIWSEYNCDGNINYMENYNSFIKKTEAPIVIKHTENSYFLLDIETIISKYQQFINKNHTGYNRKKHN